jgi:NAD(P)-dependent dehydrogenase (short-subunit alcohol dehydrogenase family)
MATRRRKARGKASATVGSDWLKGSLAGKVAIVAGASRGAGRGVAVALGDAGATVYVAGRTTGGGPKPRDGAPGTVEETAEEVTRRGGRGIAVPADCSSDSDVGALFERVQSEQGRLDLLANAVWGANEFFGQTEGKPFWELEPAAWRGVVLGSACAHLLPAVHAARVMTRQRSGLITSVTEPTIGKWDRGGSLFWMFWSVGHAVLNRMAEVMSKDLKKHGVAVVALAPGFMRTERVLMHLKTEKQKKAYGFDQSESTEYAGRAVVALAGDPNVLRRSGKLLYVADLAARYGFADVDGQQVPNFYRERKMID